MRKAFLIALFIAVSAPFALAQGTTPTYHRGEFGLAYAANWVDDDGAFNSTGASGDRDLFQGFEINGGFNFSRYVGLQGVVAHNRKEKDFSGGGFTTNVEARLTQALGGVKIQDNSTETVVKPFARALVGFGHANADVTSDIPGVGGSDSDTGFGMVPAERLEQRVLRERSPLLRSEHHADVVQVGR